MLKIGCAKIDIVIEYLLNSEIEGIKFNLISRQGIQAIFDHSALNDDIAKSVVKKALKKNSEMSSWFIGIDIV